MSQRLECFCFDIIMYPWSCSVGALCLISSRSLYMAVSSCSHIYNHVYCSARNRDVTLTWHETNIDLQRVLFLSKTATSTSVCMTSTNIADVESVKTRQRFWVQNRGNRWAWKRRLITNKNCRSCHVYGTCVKAEFLFSGNSPGVLLFGKVTNFSVKLPDMCVINVCFCARPYLLSL